MNIRHKREKLELNSFHTSQKSEILDRMLRNSQQSQPQNNASNREIIHYVGATDSEENLNGDLLLQPQPLSLIKKNSVENQQNKIIPKQEKNDKKPQIMNNIDEEQIKTTKISTKNLHINLPISVTKKQKNFF